MMKKEKKKPKREIIAAVLGAILLIEFCVYALWMKPPEIQPEPTPAPTPTPTVTAASVPTPEPTPEPLPEGEAFASERQDGVYTMLLVGLDKMSASTDTILVGRFDTKAHTMSFVSIPRDTIMNVDADIRKINGVYIGSLAFGGNGIDLLKMHINWLTGIPIDCWAVLDLDTFIKVVDEIGGVDFDVPYEVDYFFPDIEKHLYVHLDPGPQHLDGIQAMAVCRYRESYITGDLGRIEVQRAFLKACAEQILNAGNIPHAPAVVRILSEGLTTNLSAGNIAWFLREALKCKPENVRFDSMPADPKNLMGYSYAVPRLDEWLTMINEDLNPFEEPIGAWQLNMVYCDWMGNYHGTNGLDGEWYFDTTPDEEEGE